MKTIESKTASTHYRSPVQPFFSKQGENHSEAEASFFSPIPVQTKLEIGQPNDRYEQEADAMADRVVRGEASQLMGTDASPNVQMKCAACEKEQDVQRITSAKEPQGDIQTKPLLMRKAQNGASVGTPALASQLSSSRGGGQAMPTSTNQQMSQSFGTDFSGVRIHTDSRASEMNQGLSARAFTHGSDVYFNQGEYSPGSSEGKRLLAHELTHVVQQTGNNTSIQRMLACPPQYQISKDWKPYRGDTNVFHCGFRGILERRIPTPENPQNECFYDNDGTLVDNLHEFSGCQGTPNQYDSERNPVDHTLFDSGGILARGLSAYSESRRYDQYRHLPTMCHRICEARFDRCLERSRMGGMDCIPPQQRCFSRCPQPPNTSGS